MSHEEILRCVFVGLEVDDAFSEATLMMRDRTRLVLRHRVGERWARATGPDETPSEAGLAGQVLTTIAQFRLNGKHLDVQFQDGSRWEARFGRAPRRPHQDQE
jgi:hypothetical protein